MYQNKVAIRKWSFCKKSVVFLIFAFCFSFFSTAVRKISILQYSQL